MGSKVTDFREYIESHSIKVPFAGCWIWEGASAGKGGYGICELLGKRWMPHRLSYHAFNAGIPDGLDVLHKCDVPSCVNPLHLYAGTDQDNVRDRVARNRSRKTGNPPAATCKYGHPTTEPGSRTKNRSCLECCKIVWHRRCVERSIRRKEARHVEG